MCARTHVHVCMYRYICVCMYRYICVCMCTHTYGLFYKVVSFYSLFVDFFIMKRCWILPNTIFTLSIEMFTWLFPLLCFYSTLMEWIFICWTILVFLVSLVILYVLLTMMMSLLCYNFLEKFYTDAYTGCLPVDFFLVQLALWYEQGSVHYSVF